MEDDFQMDKCISEALCGIGDLDVHRSQVGWELQLEVAT